MKKAFITLIILATISSGAILNAANALTGTADQGKIVLDKHNSLRAQHCDDCGNKMLPLQWNLELAKEALKLAQYIENLGVGKLLHRWQTGNSPLAQNQLPENVAITASTSQTGGAINGENATQGWYNEINNVDWQEPGREEQLSSNGSQVVGHFTQIVWKDATKVGCATTKIMKVNVGGKTFDFGQVLVCNYDKGNMTIKGPSGEIVSGHQHNVFPKCGDKTPRPANPACPAPVSKTQTAEAPVPAAAPSKTQTAEITTPTTMTITTAPCLETFTPTTAGTQLGAGSCAYKRTVDAATGQPECIEISNVPPRHYLLSWTFEGAWDGPVAPVVRYGKTYKPKSTQQIIGAYASQNYSNVHSKTNGYKYATSGDITIKACALEPCPLESLETFSATTIDQQLGAGSCAYKRTVDAATGQPKCIEISNVPPGHYLLSWTSTGTWAGPVAPVVRYGKTYTPTSTQQIIGAYAFQNYSNAYGKTNGYKYATSGDITIKACN